MDIETKILIIAAAFAFLLILFTVIVNFIERPLKNQFENPKVINIRRR
jgi:hypothetical protein